METEFEAIQLTLGGLIFIVGLVATVAGAVWMIAKIRNTDKENIEKSYTNAINRVDSKYKSETDVLHARVNQLMEKDSQMQYKIGKLEGKAGL